MLKRRMLRDRQGAPPNAAGGGAVAAPSSPHAYPRRILLCAAGLSPSEITETLYALVVQSQPAFLPSEVHVVTTARGRDRLRQTLLAQPGGHFHAFRRDYLPEQDVLFGPGQIHVIRRHGRALVDIESPQDSSAAGDTILSVVRELAQDPLCAIHASIAGGRKSMSFLLGMSMMLLGRPQDRLSHVLVNEDFETPDFFYPPPVPVEIDSRGRSVSTRDACITLASIPLLRVFDGLGRRVGDEGRSFEDVVSLCQLEMQAPRIEVKPAGCEVGMGG